jgi:hypothetical protein
VVPQQPPTRPTPYDLGELLERVGQLDRLQGVLRARAAQHRQAGVRHHRQRHGGVLRQEAQVLAHLGRAGGAVHAEHVDAERLDGGDGRADLRPEQHRAGQLDRDLRDEHDAASAGRHRPLRPDHRGLDLQQVLGRLDEDRVDPALDHRLALLLVGVAQAGVRRVAEGRQLGARPDRPDHPARALGGGPVVGRLTGDARPGERRLEDALGDAVLGERCPVAAEGVGLDRVAADLEVGVVHAAHDVRAGDVEDLVAALVALEVPLEVEGGAGLGRLEHGPHGAVRHDHPRAQGGQQVRTDGRRVL